MTCTFISLVEFICEGLAKCGIVRVNMYIGTNIKTINLRPY
jgi:hypothetical protein